MSAAAPTSKDAPEAKKKKSGILSIFKENSPPPSKSLKDAASALGRIITKKSAKKESSEKKGDKKESSGEKDKKGEATKTKNKEEEDQATEDHDASEDEEEEEDQPMDDDDATEDDEEEEDQPMDDDDATDDEEEEQDQATEDHDATDAEEEEEDQPTEDHDAADDDDDEEDKSSNEDDETDKDDGQGEEEQEDQDKEEESEAKGTGNPSKRKGGPLSPQGSPSKVATKSALMKALDLEPSPTNEKSPSKRPGPPIGKESAAPPVKRSLKDSLDQASEGLNDSSSSASHASSSSSKKKSPKIVIPKKAAPINTDLLPFYRVVQDAKENWNLDIPLRANTPENVEFYNTWRTFTRHFSKQQKKHFLADLPEGPIMRLEETGKSNYFELISPFLLVTFHS